MYYSLYEILYSQQMYIINLYLFGFQLDTIIKKFPKIKEFLKSKS